jgi:lipopolysaccharide transport system ATP-binding protein
MSSVIQVENVSKLYRLGEVGTGSLAHDVNRWWHRLRGKEDPYTQIGQTNDRTRKAESDYVYALRDINFEVKQGEVLGIIGRNGAGKSTLLKILSRVTAPTTGAVKVKGRIAALLEVGTGFHPELTGRENIYLNGAILGMTKAEIRGKLDQIVDFSGCEAYLDTPVKRYSSGMQVRLAFAVAAHLEPEILIVDEVLAVGDAEFQSKCIGRMSEVAGEGRTVLFVSHNLQTIRTLTRNSILLEQGRLAFQGDTGSVLRRYEREDSEEKDFWVSRGEVHGPLHVEKVFLSQSSGSSTTAVLLSKYWTIHIEYTITEPLVATVLEARIHSSDGTLISVIGDYESNPSSLILRATGSYTLEMCVDPNVFNTGEYILKVNACRSNVEVLAHFDAIRFRIESDDPGRHYNKGLGYIAARSSVCVRARHIPEITETSSKCPI